MSIAYYLCYTYKMEYSNEQLNTYKSNLEFFKIINKELYNRILNLSNNIRNRRHKENYILKFKDKNINIYDTKQMKFLYNKSLNNYSSEILSHIIKDTSNLFIDLNNILYNVDKPNNIRIFNNDINTHSLYRINHDIYSFRKIFNYFKIEDKKQFKNIPAFIFFGTLLGKHLLDIDKKIKSKSYLIVEPSLEIFRLSLFITNYTVLAKSSNIIFSIEEADTNTIITYEDFITINYLDNYIFKYYSTSLHDVKLFHQFNLALQNKSSTLYNHYRQLNYIQHTVKNINKYKLLNNTSAKSLLSTKPILILSPGPSLRENFKWLKKNYNSFILVAFGATIKALYEINIKPDIIINIDASTLIINQFPKEYAKIYKNSIAILGTDSHPKVFKLFKKKNIFTFETSFKLSSNGMDEISTASVGDNTLHILLSLGFINIYMLGTDLSFTKTGLGYDKTHIQAKTKHNVIQCEKNIKKITNTIDLKSDYISTKANFKNDKVFTNRFFLHVMQNYQNIINYHKSNKNFKVYNLSNGAYIPGTIPLKVDTINVKTKIVSKKKELKNMLNLKSSLKFSSKDYDKFNIEINFLYNLIEDINLLKKDNQISFEDFDLFTRELSIKILNHKSYSQLLLNVTFGFMKTINNYINYYFNDKEKRDHKILLKTKDLWCQQILDILNQYINILKSIEYE